MSSPTQLTATKADAIRKFKSLHASNYSPKGYMICTVSDDVSDRFILSKTRDSGDIDTDITKFVWYERRNYIASDRVNIRSLNVEIPLAGRTFGIRLDRPLVKDHRYEFEYYFGFGGHCEGYTENRIVVCFPEQSDDAFDVESVLLLNGQPEDIVDAEYAKTVTMLLILSGHVKFWNAVTDFQNWFIDVAGLQPDKCNHTRDTLLEHIFNNVLRVAA